MGCSLYNYLQCTAILKMLGDNNVKHQRNIWMEQSFEFKGFWTYTMKSFSWKATNWGEGFSIEWEDLANCLHLSHVIWKNFMINIIIHGEQCQTHRYFENRYLRGIPDFLLWHIQALGNSLKMIIKELCQVSRLSLIYARSKDKPSNFDKTNQMQ